MDEAVFLCSENRCKEGGGEMIMLHCMISMVQQGLGGIGKITNQARLLLQWEIAIVDLRGILICLLGVYVILRLREKL